MILNYLRCRSDLPCRTQPVRRPSRLAQSGNSRRDKRDHWPYREATLEPRIQPLMSVAFGEVKVKGLPAMKAHQTVVICDSFVPILTPAKAQHNLICSAKIITQDIKPHRPWTWQRGRQTARIRVCTKYSKQGTLHMWTAWFRDFGIALVTSNWWCRFEVTKSTMII